MAFIHFHSLCFRVLIAMVTNYQWEPCPVPRVTGANKKEHFSFIPFRWLSDRLPWKADYSDRTRLGSGSMWSQTGRSERTGNYRRCEGVHLLIQISCTRLTVSTSSAMLLLCSLSDLGKEDRCSVPKMTCETSSFKKRGQLNTQFMVHMISEW